MTSVSHGPTTFGSSRPQWAEFLRIREMWASLAISMMWIAVAITAVWGPDFVTTSAGASTTTIPSALGVALFAFLGSASVAKYALRGDKES